MLVLQTAPIHDEANFDAGVVARYTGYGSVHLFARRGVRRKMLSHVALARCDVLRECDIARRRCGNGYWQTVECGSATCMHRACTRTCRTINFCM